MGSVTRRNQVSGVWTLEKSELHFNLLEFKAMGLALVHWTSLVRGKSVVIEADSSTAFAFL